MEIGSFLELDLNDYREYYSDNENTARLNSARSSIYHALRVLGCDSISIPFYLCPTVKNFLLRKGITVKEYNITHSFEPDIRDKERSEAILIVNYFGIFSTAKMENIISRYDNVIIDNSQAFFSGPFENSICIYSPRKFFGVPDGGYATGKNVHLMESEYETDISSETSAFLLKRIEMGSSAIYDERMKNERRIDDSDIKRMSFLTRRLLKSVNYENILTRRRTNFLQACDLYAKINLINPHDYFDSDCAPLVYPLVVEDPGLVEKLISKQIYTGRWWKSVISSLPFDSFEVYLSRYLVPMPIDQRYGSDIIKKCHGEVISCLLHR